MIADPGTNRAWGHGKLQVDFDLEDAQANVLHNFGQISSPLTATQLISIRPTAQQDQKAYFPLSDLIDTVIPRIKIFASKHVDGTVDVLPHVFLDDRNNHAQNFIDLQQQAPGVFGSQGDQLHELTIAGDSNIVWDACRDMIL